MQIFHKYNLYIKHIINKQLYF